MRIRFLGGMPQNGYSGGRLLALTMAESLALTGAKVDFLVDNIPQMYEEFRPHSRITIEQVDFRNLSPWVDRTIDVVVIVPGRHNLEGHSEWTRHALECHAKIVLLNFETPNWFNSVSPVPKEESYWEGWVIPSRYANLILSISKEGNRYAQQYFNNVPATCRFDFCYPAIHSLAADQAPESKKRRNQIVFLTRVDPHKGFADLEALLTPKLNGYTLSVFIGTGTFPQKLAHKLQGQFHSQGMQLEILSAITGVKKFTLLKQAALLYFPTKFEGFGIPPLEAAYCNLPVACSELPVLKEYGRDAFSYADPYNTNAMTNAILQALDASPYSDQEVQRFRNIASMEQWGQRQLTQYQALF